MSRLPDPHLPPNLSNRRVARLRAAFWVVENALIARTLRRARAVLEAAATKAAAAPPAATESSTRPDDDRVRVLRWVFARRLERLTCELALSDDDACYELRTMTSTTQASRSVERFSDVSVAFQRQSALEGRLVNDGWSLESYDSVIVERRPPRSIAV